VQVFPVFLKLAGKKVVVVGGGSVAASKIAALADAGARITVVAPAIHAEIARQPVSLETRCFRPSDLAGAWFVVSAATPGVNARVAALANARNIFVNAVDDPQNASAYLGGVIRRGSVAVAVSTNGRAPALAGLLREGIDRMLPRDLARWLRQADRLRASWRRRRVPMPARRPSLLAALNGQYTRGGR
jgi:uroporphyrin-III C-methyltransferase/precorrin-2 dehydrogenase/sirohydrochlorin ferrochelatase